MGFDVGRTFKLEWPETHFLYGALIRMRSAPLGLSLRIRNGMAWEELVAAMCAHVAEWDLEIGGKPVELVTATVLESIDQPVLVAIARAWQDASAGVTAPLDATSGDGPASPDMDELELSIPMESLSEDQRS